MTPACGREGRVRGLVEPKFINRGGGVPFLCSGQAAGNTHLTPTLAPNSVARTGLDRILRGTVGEMDG